MRNIKLTKLSELRGEKLEGSGRLTELFYPLYAVALTQQIKNEIVTYVRDIEKEQLEALKLTPEVTVLSAILEAKRQGLMKNDRIMFENRHIQL